MAIIYYRDDRFEDNKHRVKGDKRHSTLLSRYGFSFDWDDFSYYSKSALEAHNLLNENESILCVGERGVILQALFEETAEARANEAVENERRTLIDKASRALTPSEGFACPIPEGLEFLPYQLAGIESALKRDGVLLGDEMGLGKTVQAIGVLNKGPEIKSVLIICGASLQKNWLNEIEKFSTRKELNAQILKGNSNIDADISIVSYGMFSRETELTKTLCARQYDMLILDEAHSVKNWRAERTKRILGSGGKTKGIEARKKLFLTGTPVLNKPSEIWPMVHALDSKTFSNVKQFYRDFVYQDNGDELGKILRKTVLIRREKADVLVDLPAKLRRVVTLSASTKDEREALTNEREWIAQKKEIEKAEKTLPAQKKKLSDDEYLKQVAQLSNRRSEIAGGMSRVRKQTAIAKAPQCVSFIKDALEETETDKFIVFAHHQDVLNILEEGLKDYGVCRIDGSVDSALRQGIVDSFQSKPEKRIFLGSILACAEGITLTASSRVVFCELDWTPARMQQAEDRAHRIGQKDTVFVQYLVLEDSIDADMITRNVEKSEAISEILQ